MKYMVFKGEEETPQAPEETPQAPEETPSQ